MRTRKQSPRSWPAIALLGLLAACSPAPSATVPAASADASAGDKIPNAPSTQKSGRPTTTPASARAFDVLLSHLGPKGEISPEIALQAFALSVAPLPGVTPPSGSRDGIDVDTAVSWIAQVWPELSTDQHAAIDRAMAPFADPFGPAAADTGAPRAVLAAWHPQIAATTTQDCGKFHADPTSEPAPASTAIGPYVDMMRTATATIAGHLHRSAPDQLAVCLLPEGIMSGPALSRLYDAEHLRVGLPTSCAVFLDSGAVGDLDASGDLPYAIAFETYLCFARTADPTETIASAMARKVPTWALAGSAAWAAATVSTEDFGGIGTRTTGLWTTYLSSPELSLSRRGTDALGFFAQVDADKPSAWDVLDQVVLGADSLDSFYQATGRRDTFIERWAAGYFRDASRGDGWDITGPGIPTDTPEAGSIEIGNGDQEEMAAPAMAVATADLSISSDVTVVDGVHLRAHDGVQDVHDVRHQTYCTKDGGGDACACPEGTPGAGRPPLPPLGTEVKLALTGMEFSEIATINGLSLEDYCGPLPSAAPDSGIWSMVYWSPDLGDSVPPILAAYTCDGLHSTWKAIFLPSTDGMKRTFELAFDDQPVAHVDMHMDIPPDKESPATDLDYSVDYELVTTDDPPVFHVTGTKTESQKGATWVLQPHEFGSDAPLVLVNGSLESQLKPYPAYQHPFRAQALAECGQ